MAAAVRLKCISANSRAIRRRERHLADGLPMMESGREGLRGGAERCASKKKKKKVSVGIIKKEEKMEPSSRPFAAIIAL